MARIELVELSHSYVVKPVKFSDFLESVSQLGIFWALVNEPPPGSLPLVATETSALNPTPPGNG